MAKLLYKPIGIVVGVLGGIVAGRVFKRVWAMVAGEEDPPSATDRNKSWREIVPAAALEGAIFGAVKAAIDRGGATAFHRATGSWPGAESGAASRRG